jgi:hypothetical protein
MEERSLIIPNRAISALEDLFIPHDAPSDSYLCLSIIIEDSKVNVSEFAAYLNLINSTYGRLSPRGIYAYSMRREEQLTINEFGHNSQELKFIESIASGHGFIIIILCLLLRYLRYLPIGLEKLSVAYKNYEEGRLFAERRKLLRRKIRDDADLAKLSDDRKKQLTILIDELFLRGRRFLPKSSRFTEKYVRRIKINVLPNSEKEDNNK